jgi:hypothetical protein
MLLQVNQTLRHVAIVGLKSAKFRLIKQGQHLETALIFAPPFLVIRLGHFQKYNKLELSFLILHHHDHYFFQDLFIVIRKYYNIKGIVKKFEKLKKA